MVPVKNIGNRHRKLLEMTKIALIAALYIVFALAIPGFSYGQIQFRLSEAFNVLVVFNKRYIWALTLGCFIVNLFSPYGWWDIIFGTAETFIMTSISYFLSKKVKSLPAKFGITISVCALSSWIIALELFLSSKIPFWMSYLTIGISEAIAVGIGAIIFGLISKRIDLAK